MNKRLIIATITVLVLVAAIVFFYQLSLIDDSPGNNPTNLGSYRGFGYYQINPDTILVDLNQGKTDLFTPLLEDPDKVAPSLSSITWMQSDYLKIADALSKEIWKEPLDLRSWRVFDAAFRKGCVDNLSGFDEFSITYYKTIKVGWEIEYSARIIEMEPWHGIVGGGSDTFTAPILFGWHNVELTKFKIPAEAALQIAEKNGGRDAREKSGNKCVVYVTMFPQDNGMWDVYYDRADINMKVNPYTGNYNYCYGHIICLPGF